jgi:hypothetical protein
VIIYWTFFIPIGKFQTIEVLKEVLSKDLVSLENQSLKCIGVDDILTELRFLRSILEKPLKLVVEVTDSTPAPVVTPGEDFEATHVPAWDITDTDFETFPSLPAFSDVTEDTTIDVLVNDTANVTWLVQLAQFKDEHATIFVLTLTIALIVIVTVFVLMVWFCCVRECLKKKVPVAPIAKVEEIYEEISSSHFGEDVNFDDIFEPRDVLECEPDNTVISRSAITTTL